MKKNRIIFLLLTLVLVLGSSSFAEGQDNYTLMIYLNGSDLESTYDPITHTFSGAATQDLNEMIDGYKVGSGVNVIVQTGGTAAWDNDFVYPEVTQRFELTENGFVEMDSLPRQNFGYKKTLSDFMNWGVKNYPADKYAIILWNHGGGPVKGYGLDELSDYDSLHLEELAAAFSTSKEQTGVTFELIGFDACLMASIEVADTLDAFGKYLVASEEIEPGHGWDYQSVLTALSANPNLTGDYLGTIIADTYLAHAKTNGTESEVTLSVIDLTKIDSVVEALENLIVEADQRLYDNIFFYEFARSALAAKSFGGNTETQGFTDLIDLDDFASALMLNQEENASALISAVNQAVVHKIDGPYSFNTGGLSIYFPYRDRENYAANIDMYKKTLFSPVYINFLGGFKSTVEAYEKEEAIEYTVYEPTDENPYYELSLTQDGFEKVYYVYIDIYTAPMLSTEKPYDTQYLGYDFLVTPDEENFSYFDDFNFQWTYLDTEPLMMFVTHDYDDVVLYESPVLYNGEPMNLIFSWITEFSLAGEDLSRYEIYGLRRTVDPETGMPDKNLYQLEPGAVIQPIYVMDNYYTGDSDYVAGNEIVISEYTDLYFEDLPAEDYMFNFRLTDFAFNHWFTDSYFFELDSE